MASVRKILGISASGIGNTILFTPVLRALRRNFPSAQIDLVCGSPAMAEPVTGSPSVDRVLPLPDSAGPLASFTLRLRREEYDVSLCGFPNIRPEYNAFAFTVGADARVTHSYGHSRIRSLSFLQNVTVPAVEGLHDVENNLRLLRGLGLDPSGEDPAPWFHLEPDNRRWAEQYLAHRDIGPGVRVVGVHAGSGDVTEKRWGVENFASELRRLLARREGPVAILLMGGEEEGALNRKLAARLSWSRTHLPRSRLKNIAALIARCDWFLSNDSGLMHCAAAFGVEQKAVFLHSNPDRTRPWNDRARILDLRSDDAYRYPFDSLYPPG